MSTLDNLSKLSADLGTNIRLVQGAGGNVSLKDGDTLWVKASGTWLADAQTRPIFVSLDLPTVRTALAVGSDDFKSAIKDNSGLRPSIETSLHALMPQRVVVHVHSINALSWGVRRDGKLAVAEKLKGLPWEWVDYVRPGLPLTQAVSAALAATPNATVLLLANHGLVVAADSTQAAIVLLNDIEHRLQPIVPPISISAEIPTLPISSGSRLPTNILVNRLARIPDYLKLLKGALYPDHVVFLGNSIPMLSTQQEMDIEETLNTYPYCAAVADKGIILGEQCSAGAEAMLECLALLAPLLVDAKELRFLNLEEIAEISNWDAEKARQKASRINFNS